VSQQQNMNHKVTIILLLTITVILTTRVTYQQHIFEPLTTTNCTIEGGKFLIPGYISTSRTNSNSIWIPFQPDSIHNTFTIMFQFDLTRAMSQVENYAKKPLKMIQIPLLLQPLTCNIVEDVLYCLDVQIVSSIKRNNTVYYFQLSRVELNRDTLIVKRSFIFERKGVEDLNIRETSITIIDQLMYLVLRYFDLTSISVFLFDLSASKDSNIIIAHDELSGGSFHTAVLEDTFILCNISYDGTILLYNSKERNLIPTDSFSYNNTLIISESYSKDSLIKYHLFNLSKVDIYDPDDSYTLNVYRYSNTDDIAEHMASNLGIKYNIVTTNRIIYLYERHKIVWQYTTKHDFQNSISLLASVATRNKGYFMTNTEYLVCYSVDSKLFSQSLVLENSILQHLVSMIVSSDEQFIFLCM
jgi:hypothetical protein